MFSPLFGMATVKQRTYEVIGYTAAVYAMSGVAYTAAVYATSDIAYTAAVYATPDIAYTAVIHTRGVLWTKL